ncbi:MAG: DUF1684 domain-containing protein [Flavobacteriaceae bacterium]
MKYLILNILLLANLSIVAQTEAEIRDEIKTYQTELNKEFINPETTILDEKHFADFGGLEFYPINLKYRIEANFVRTPNEKPFLMKTTTDRLPEYVKYGEAQFELDGKELQLILYKSTDSWGDPEKYGNQLFLPFTDLTSGDGSYGGGRFMEVTIPEGRTIILDFNKVYNPYCAYNSRYSCPIPPAENDLQVRIEAGVKDFGEH